MGMTLTNDKPVAKVSAVPHVWINHLENHTETEEMGASEEFLLEK
jgi:hypothetical protein